MPSPTDLAGLWTWLKANDQTGFADGATLTTCEDSSGNSRDGTPAGDITFETNELNGRAVIRFGGVDNRVALPDMSALTAGTVYIVVKAAADPPANDAAANGLWDLGTDVGQTSHFPYSDGVVYEAFGTTTRKTVGDLASSLAAWRLYSVRSAPNDWEAFLDGVSVFSTATNTVGFPAAPTLGEGENAAYDLTADVAEFILFSTPHVTAERRWVEQYVFDEYALGNDYGLGAPMRMRTLGGQSFAPGLYGPGTDKLGDMR